MAACAKQSTGKGYTKEEGVEKEFAPAIFEEQGLTYQIIILFLATQLVCLTSTRKMTPLFRKTIELPLELIELEEHNYHLMLKSRMADGKDGWWIVDTGASKTVFDRNRENYFTLEEGRHPQQYQSAGIAEGMVETRVGKLARLHFGALRIKDLKVALIDLNHVNEIYSRYHDKQVVGLLGSDILANYGCCINYGSKSIRFQTKPQHKTS
ncbi:MAG: retropepsin-like aspartic protease [Mangrovibacterium sp.]